MKTKPTKEPKPFSTEADLCAAFIAVVGSDWTAYAETAGWDILLVRNIDGFQIGVQAKLKLNIDVFAQTIERKYHTAIPGPDCRAILVPWGEAQRRIGMFSAYVGVTIIRMTTPPTKKKVSYRFVRAFEPALPKLGEKWSEGDWYEMAPVRRCKLPDYVPDVRAGSSAPLQLTDWKIGALKIAALLERDGFVTRDDFKRIRIDHRRWVAPFPGWLRVEGGRFVRGVGYPNFEASHPTVFAQIKADMPKWADEKSATERLL